MATLIRIIIWFFIGIFASIGFILCIPVFILGIVFGSAHLGFLISKNKKEKKHANNEVDIEEIN